MRPWNDYSRVIEKAETGSKQHLGNSEDDRRFHLERVREQDFVGGDLPDLQPRRRQKEKAEQLSEETLREQVVRWLWQGRAEECLTGSNPNQYGSCKYVCSGSRITDLVKLFLGIRSQGTRNLEPNKLSDLAKTSL